ncbi:MAG: hypothetical protein LBD35_05550 [Prevotellaceae bacterium]|jgi:hypothetical protein|nr:hypothetical protein [Prevotellaceae bacterium]
MLFIVIAALSCGDQYEEKTGANFEGTWTLHESRMYYDSTGSGLQTDTAGNPITDTLLYSFNNPLDERRFMHIRPFNSEKLLLFYTRGRYDSSFFFRVDENILFVRRVMDSVPVKIPYNINGRDTFEIVYRPLKPLNPQTEYEPEKYYGTLSFSEGASLNMMVRRYKTDPNGSPTGILLYEDLYMRPDEN